jgi:hypothetical protein
MKTYTEFIAELTTQQRMKRAITMKKKSKIIARKRAISMKKPPSQEKVKKAIAKAVRSKAMAIVDKMGIYKTASAGVKAGLEKKADLKVQKSGAKWATRLKPEIRKRMKDAFRSRSHVKNPEG